MFENRVRDGGAPIGNVRRFTSPAGLSSNRCRAPVVLTHRESATTGYSRAARGRASVDRDSATLLAIASRGDDGTRLLASRRAPGRLSRPQIRRRPGMANTMARLAQAARLSVAARFRALKKWVMTRLETCPTLFHRFRASLATT